MYYIRRTNGEGICQYIKSHAGDYPRYWTNDLNDAIRMSYKTAADMLPEVSNANGNFVCEVKLLCSFMIGQNICTS